MSLRANVIAELHGNADWSHCRLVVPSIIEVMTESPNYRNNITALAPSFIKTINVS